MSPRRLPLALALLAAAACAKPAPRAPAASGDEWPYPYPRAGEVTLKEKETLDEAWHLVLAGDLARAERDYLKVLRRRPGLVPAQTGLGVARLRGGRVEEARSALVAVVETARDYAPALYGAAEASLQAGDAEAALRFMRRAEAADPGSALMKRRLSELRLQVTERRMAAARAESAAGDFDGAADIYRRALGDAPEVAGLRLELAELLAGRGEAAEAMAVLEGDPTEDRQVLLKLGELRAASGDHAGALEAYRRLLARDPRDEEALALADRSRTVLEMRGMPEEYLRIAGAETITRADLAALVAVKVTALGRLPPGAPKVAVDISGSWAREHILKALAYDVMTVYPNHTFQPGAVARRGDLARAVQRVLDLVRHPAAPAPAITDMSRSHLFHYPAARVVAAGLMDLTPEGAFQAWRPPTGAEAASVIDSLARLVGP
ncbi:MAG TPA: tetratricopeptide repeat protein [Vicinamibacteria bacterium]